MGLEERRKRFQERLQTEHQSQVKQKSESRKQSVAHLHSQIAVLKEDQAVLNNLLLAFYPFSKYYAALFRHANIHEGFQIARLFIVLALIFGIVGYALGAPLNDYTGVILSLIIGLLGYIPLLIVGLGNRNAGLERINERIRDLQTQIRA